MLKVEFKALLDLMEQEEHETILGKGDEYTRGQADRLASFKEIASFAGVTPKQVCMIFVAKHWQAVANFVATGKTKSNEPIEGRIMDIRVYMSLLRALIQEERQAKKGGKEAATEPSIAPPEPRVVGGCRHVWANNPSSQKPWCATCGAFKAQ